MTDHFWRDWRLFYLPTLQKRHKWTGVSANISVGDLVLLKEANAPRNQWPRARVRKVQYLQAKMFWFVLWRL